jgi:hypothetical protein
MPAFPARRLASSALCAALLLGVTAPAALAADVARERTQEAAPLPNTEALRGQVKQLNELSAVTTPVTALVNAAVNADNGQVPAAEATRLGNAAKAAIAKAATTMASVTLPASTTPAAPVTPAVPSAPPASTSPATVPLTPAASQVRDDSGLPFDDWRDELALLQQAVDALIKAITSGDPAQVGPAATALLGALVNAVNAIADATGLPVVPGLPVPPSA